MINNSYIEEMLPNSSFNPWFSVWPLAELLDSLVKILSGLMW